MKTKLKLNKLLNSLPDATKQALERLSSEGYFGESDTVVKRRAVVTEAEQFGDGERAVRQYISTRDVDRDQDVLVPKGAILDQFLLAPQVLWAHDYSCPPIGKATSVVVDSYGLRAKTVFADTERGEEVWQLVKGGFLATASVGFIPMETVWQGDTKWRETVDKLNRSWETDLEKDGCNRIVSKWLLLEYSMVPVPANPNALVTAVAKGGISLSADMRKALGVDVDDEDEDETPEVPEEKHVEVVAEPERRIIAPVTREKQIIEVVKRPSDPGRIAIAVLDQLRGRV